MSLQWLCLKNSPHPGTDACVSFICPLYVIEMKNNWIMKSVFDPCSPHSLSEKKKQKFKSNQPCLPCKVFKDGWGLKIWKGKEGKTRDEHDSQKRKKKEPQTGIGWTFYEEDFAHYTASTHACYGVHTHQRTAAKSCSLACITMMHVFSNTCLSHLCDIYTLKIYT